MVEARWMGDIRGARAGTLYWADQLEGDGRFSVGLPDHQTLAFLTRPKAGDTSKYLLYFPPSAGTPNPLAAGELSLEINESERRAGTWRLWNGAEGIFNLVPAAVPSPSGAHTPAPPPLIQFWNKDTPLGAITLYRSDLERLIAELESFVPEPRLTVIRANENDQIIVNKADTYLSRKDYPEVVRELVITCEEVVTQGYRKIITLNLNDDASSTLGVSSPDELWTAAVSIRTEKFITQFTSGLTGWLRKKGLNINSLILVGIIIWMPDRPLIERVFGFIAAVIAIFVIFKSHQLVPYTRVYLNPDKVRRPFEKEVPSIVLTSLAGVLAGVVSALPSIIDKVRHIADNIWRVIGGF